MPLSRRQLFEFNDLPAAPAALKETIVEALSRALDWGRMMDGVVPPFVEFRRAAGVSEMLDLGAGAGGPAQIMVRALCRRGEGSPRFVLTDLLPRVATWRRLSAEHPAHIDYVSTPVDATDIEPALAAGRGRVVINVLHHFPPALVHKILADAVAKRSPLFISEAFGRQPSQFLNFIPAGLLALWLNPLLCETRQFEKALLTWFSPVATAASAWDGFVSTLRAYEEPELRAMVADVPGHQHFSWVFGRYRYPPRGTGMYLYGTPR